MTNRINWLTLSIIWMIIMMYPAQAQADSIGSPYPYKKPIPGTGYVFVMPVDGKAVTNSKGKPYPKAGLYNGDDIIPLWTVDWYESQGRIFLSRDGKSLARLGPWPLKGDFNEKALLFYRNGRLTRDYSVRDFVSSPEALPESVSHYEWLEDLKYNEKDEILFLKTMEGRELSFNIKNGQLTKGELARLTNPKTLYLSGSALIILVLIVYFGIRKRKI